MCFSVRTCSCHSITLSHVILEHETLAIIVERVFVSVNHSMLKIIKNKIYKIFAELETNHDTQPEITTIFVYEKMYQLNSKEKTKNSNGESTK